MKKTFALLSCALVLGYAIAVLAQPRSDLRPPLLPVASSSSNGASFAWFYDPAERAVIVCKSGAAPSEGVDCKARAVLP